MKILKYFTNNEFVESNSSNFYEVFNPSTGELIAKTPKLTSKEVDKVIENASNAYKIWSKVPVGKRVQILYKVRQLIEDNLDELTLICAKENGKNYYEAQGDILKAKEGTEQAISAPVLMQGDSIMNISNGYDCVMYRESLGVFVGIAPFNFPAMIPMGWMVPMCIATGNTIVLKTAGITPMTSLRIAELYREAGLPDGVLNVICCDRNDTKRILTHPEIKGISFVGSTSVGKSIYSTAASYGKRVQALCEAKNHALVLEDANIERAAATIVNSSFGCAGERCMALPVVVAQDSIADMLIEEIKKMAKELKMGPAYCKETKLGPVISREHKNNVINWINKGLEEGATMVLDGRNTVVEGYENGYYLGPTILDNVTEEMTVGRYEIFGPVLCIKRVNSFEEGIRVMNDNPFANGSVIYTESGYYAREFTKLTDGGMVGVNVGIPVPIANFPFCGHKDSFFGDLHTLGKDGVKFFTESKLVTTHWFNSASGKKVGTWEVI